MSYEAFREQCAKIVAAWGYPILAGTIRALPLPGVTQEPLAWLIKDIGMVTTSKAERDRWIESRRDVVELVDIQPETEALRKENEQLRQRISHLENACAIQSIDLSADQLREARDFVFVDDGLQDEKECVARIAELLHDRALIGDNNVRMKPGLYVCDAEYPEEGWMPLFDDADNDADETLKGGAA